jgi:hypothetical protein
MDQKRIRKDRIDPGSVREPMSEQAGQESITPGIGGNDAAAYLHHQKGKRDKEVPLTGFDAAPEDADVGDAGNGASPHGGDLSGLPRDEENQDHLTSLEEDSGQSRDIRPDQVVGA